MQTFEEVLIGQKANPWNDKQYGSLKKVINVSKYVSAEFLT